MLSMATIIWVSYTLWLLHNQMTALLNRAHVRDGKCQEGQVSCQASNTQDSNINPIS